MKFIETKYKCVGYIYVSDPDYESERSEHVLWDRAVLKVAVVAMHLMLFSYLLEQCFESTGNVSSGISRLNKSTITIPTLAYKTLHPFILLFLHHCRFTGRSYIYWLRSSLKWVAIFVSEYLRNQTPRMVVLNDVVSRIVTANLLFIAWRETENRTAGSLVCSLFMFTEYVLGRIRPINCSRHKASVQLGLRFLVCFLSV